MAPSFSTLSTLFLAIAGCTNSPIELNGLVFIDTSKAPIPVKNLSATRADNGFGSAVTTAMGKVWVGAPHGSTAKLYAWDENGLNIQLESTGRLGSHLAGSAAFLWASAPAEERVVDHNGALIRDDRPSTGIALSNEGHVAWASGWIGPDGTEGTTPGRPTALHAWNGLLGVGMAHGPIAFAAGDQSWPRPKSNDEAGFSVSSGRMEGMQVWLVGAPASGHVYAIDTNSFTILADWSGNGRFGHAIAVADIDGDSVNDLIVGAPLDGPTGSVTVFYSFGGSGETLDIFGNAQTGSSLHASSDRLLVGAPGGPGSPGMVLMMALP